MGNDNINVGKKTANRKPGPPKPERPEICGAMTQQRCDSGRSTELAPQKLVQLVGYRDPNALHEPRAGLRATPVKR